MKRQLLEETQEKGNEGSSSKRARKLNPERGRNRNVCHHRITSKER